MFGIQWVICLISCATSPEIQFNKAINTLNVTTARVIYIYIKVPLF